MAFNLTDFNTFVATTFKTINLALQLPSAKSDILAAVAAITKAVIEEGANPLDDLAALQSLNVIVTNLAAAKTQVQA
jgi:hypothetical protein